MQVKTQSIVQGRLLGVEEKLYKVFVFLVVRGIVHIWRRVFCQVVYKVLVLGVSKSGKKNLKRIAWGTGCRSQGLNQDKSLIFAFAFSKFYLVNFLFPASSFI